MTNYYFRKRTYILFLTVLLISSCTGQVTTNLNEQSKNAQITAPEITGTPPVLMPGNDPELVSQYIRSIYQDSKGNLWFAPAGQSVARYDVRTLHYFSRAEFFHGNDHIDYDYGNSVHAIAEDRNGNIWFGTDNGIIKYDGKNFRSYTEKNGLSNISVGRKCILTDKNGALWVGTAVGVFLYDPSADSTDSSDTRCFSQFDLLPPVNIKGIMEDSAGTIWFASENNGIFRYDGKMIENITGKEGLGNNYAGGMVQDRTGNYWFTMKGGICSYNAKHKTFTEFTTEDGLGGSEVWGIYMESSGMIWITARGSTTRYDPSMDISDPKAFTVFTEEDGINCCVQTMYQDRSGNMWWGAGAGLYRFNGKRFYQVKQKGPW